VHDPGVVVDRNLIVLGAGPAGLAAGATATERGAGCVVLDRGGPLSRRSRGRPADLVVGVGGAGLYSDGKFSFAPSASALWHLQPRELLEESYQWVAALLRRHGVPAPPFSEEMAEAARNDDGSLKPYPSRYMSPQDRLSLVNSLADEIGARLEAGTAWDLAIDESGVVAAALSERRIRASAAVVATGRFGPLDGVRGVDTRFRRVEVGMRVEQGADEFAMDLPPYSSLLDPKWIESSSDGRLEWRTFCCCRRGEVVDTLFGDLTTVSGRADGPETDRSNFGLNVRFLDEPEALDALRSILTAARGAPLRVEAAELLDERQDGRVAKAIGATVAGALAAGLEALGEATGRSFRAARLHLPALEGVGYYPVVDDTLRVAPAVWAAGDATGRFRGLVPALVSGRMAALAAIDSMGLA
jgi:uncharacterized protein